MTHASSSRGWGQESGTIGLSLIDDAKLAASSPDLFHCVPIPGTRDSDTLHQLMELLKEIPR